MGKRIKVEEVVSTALSKTLGEMLMTPIVGNGTVVSGITKLGIAYVISPKLKGAMKGIAYGLAIDGAEDLVFSLFGRVGIGLPAQQEQGVVI